MHKLFITAFSVFLIGGCIGIKSFPPAARSDQIGCNPLSAAISPLSFSYPSNLAAPIMIEEKILETERYQSFFLSMPSSGPNGQDKNLAAARYFKNKLGDQKKLVVILPIYGSSTYPPDITALQFTEWNHYDDTNVLVIFGENDIYNPDTLTKANTEKIFLKAIGESAEKVKNSVIDVRRFIDWTVKQPEINDKRIGIIGFSVGASVASIITGVDKRIAGGAFVMGGADFGEIFAFSKADFIKEARKKITEKFGWTKEILSQKIKPYLDGVNPKYFAACFAPFNGHRVLIVDAENDDVIPENTRRDLYIAWRKPELISVAASHKTAFLTMTLFNFNRLNRYIFDFFNNNI